MTINWWSKYNLSSLNLTPLLYWELFIGWVWLVKSKHKKPEISFKSGLAFYAAGTIVSVLGFLNFSEVLMRLGFIGWYVGIVQAIINIVRNKD